MTTYTSMDRIFTKFAREVSDEFDEGDMIEMAGEALEFIHAPKSYEPYVAFIEVRNNQCLIPAGTHIIDQIARNNAWSGPKCKELCPSHVQDSLNCVPETGCVPHAGVNPCVCPPANAVWLDCNGRPIVAYDLAYYRPYFNLKLESFNTFNNTSYYRRNFTPIRLATNSMFAGMVCNPRPSPYVRSEAKDEYQIIAGTTLRFSFREGAIALAYTRQLIDNSTGYPMIPDNISYTTAITKYILLKKFEKQFYAGRDGAEKRMLKAEADWQWYCGQASNNERMPNGVDEHQNFMDQRQHILPNTNSYYGFFGNLNNPEQRLWNDRFHGGNGSIGDGINVSGGNGGDDIIIANSTEIIDPTWSETDW